AENVVPLLARLAAEVTTPFRFLAIFDHDEDTTLPVLAAVQGAYRFPIETRKNRYGRGALGAVRTGLETADGLAVAVIMADLADDLRIVDRMYHLIADEG